MKKLRKNIISFLVVLGVSAAISTEVEATNISNDKQEDYYVITSQNESYIATKSELKENGNLKGANESQISYTLENGTLTISGTGSIQSTAYTYRSLPWYSNKDEITSFFRLQSIAA